MKIINANFKKEKVLDQHNIILEKLPSKKEVLNLIEQKCQKNINELILYKSNTLDEPCKRVELNKFTL